MPRHKPGLETGRARKAGKKTETAASEYAAGWLVVPGGQPEEDLVYLAGSAYTTLYVGAKSKTIYKTLKNSGEWFRFAFVTGV